MSVARNKSTFASWLELLRVPNLLTVPGDPVAGYLLAMQADASLRFSILAVAAASVCFYAAGLLLNDLHDLEIDRCQRPERPLPSSRIAVPEAVIALAILLGAGIGLCATAGLRALLAGLLLVTAIVTYNLFLKNVPLVGALGMGLCRGHFTLPP